MGKKLYKSSLDRKILAGGSGVLFYIVAALIMPDEPEYY